MSEVQLIPVDKITADWEWNSRTGVTEDSVAPLATSIQENGLEVPVVVRPLGDGYGLVSGFRRFKAVSEVLGKKEIACFVRKMSDFEARLANFRENGERQQLTFWEECLFLKATFPDNVPMIEIQRSLNKSYDWSRARRKVWTLPKTIIQLAKEGIYTGRDVNELLKRDPVHQREAARLAEAARRRGESGKQIRKNTFTRRHVQGRKNMNKMMNIIEKHNLSSDPRIHDLFLWAMGDLTKADLAAILKVDADIFLMIEE